MDRTGSFSRPSRSSPASLPEGEDENSPGWSPPRRTQSGESVPIESARPVGAERTAFRPSSNFHAIPPAIPLDGQQSLQAAFLGRQASRGKECSQFRGLVCPRFDTRKCARRFLRMGQSRRDGLSGDPWPALYLRFTGSATAPSCQSPFRPGRSLPGSPPARRFR